MEDMIVAVIIGCIIGIAIYYIKKERRKGIKCIGCPFADNCSSKQKEDCNHQRED